MKTISDLSESNAVLERYHGANAQIWAFNISLKRLLIKLSQSDQSEILFIIVVGCEHMIGPFSWKNAGISIVQNKNIKSSEIITRITDNQIGFELTASGGFALALGQEADFDKSFVNFSEVQAT